MQKKGTAGIHVVLSSNKNATICMFIMFNTSTNCPQLSQCFEHSWHSCPTATPFALAREQQSQLPKSWYDFRRCYERWDTGVEHPGALACSDFHRLISVPKLGCSELASSAKPSRQSSLFGKHRFKPVVLVAFIIYIQLTSSNLLLSKTN